MWNVIYGAQSRCRKRSTMGFYKLFNTDVIPFVRKKAKTELEIFFFLNEKQVKCLNRSALPSKDIAWRRLEFSKSKDHFLKDNLISTSLGALGPFPEIQISQFRHSLVLVQTKRNIYYPEILPRSIPPWSVLLSKTMKDNILCFRLKRWILLKEKKKKRWEFVNDHLVLMVNYLIPFIFSCPR